MDYQECGIAINVLLQNVGSKYAQAQNQQFAGQNLTASQISILLLLDQNGSMRVSDVAAALYMRESNVSNICTRLENAGLILRDRSKTDRRVVTVELTAEAKEKMDGIKTSVNDFHRKMQECVCEADLKDIHTGLAKLNKLFDLLLDSCHRG